MSDRYASWDSGIGAAVDSGAASFEKLETYIIGKDEAEPNRGSCQELLENQINELIWAKSP